MTMVGSTAREIAAAVRAGEVTAREVVAGHLDRIERLNPTIGAFRVVRREQALAEADAVDSRHDRYSLPLAGVPVAVKDNVAVAGERVTHGSRAVRSEPAGADHEVVRRLRAAGAVVVGLTREPELGLWATTDGADAVTRNPWHLGRTPGGSSGGSAAAVAAGLVPIAHGNDGLGSLRIPAACCGLVTMKPGAGVVPTRLGSEIWDELAADGVLATTAADLALGHAVLAGVDRVDDEPRVEPAPRTLRIAVSTRSAVPGTVPDPHARAAVTRARQTMHMAGYLAPDVEPPFSLRDGLALGARWFAAADWTDNPRIEPAALQRRTRVHGRLGRIVNRLGLVRASDRAAAIDRVTRFFDDWQLVLSPVLASGPPAAGWSGRGWLANAVGNSRYAPYSAIWNLLGFPAAAVPVGVRPDGMPLAVQLVAPPGGEPLLLSVAAEMQRRSPWPRHAPGFAPVGPVADPAESIR